MGEMEDEFVVGKMIDRIFGEGDYDRLKVTVNMNPVMCPHINSYDECEVVRLKWHRMLGYKILTGQCPKCLKVYYAE